MRHTTFFGTCFFLVFLGLVAVNPQSEGFAQADHDYLAEFQRRAVLINQADWAHWGDRDDIYSSHTTHSNRLIPAYTWGVSLDSVHGKNSIYRDKDRLRERFGFLPSASVNPKAEYFDQTDIYHLQRGAWKSGKKHIILMVFDGMDWDTTRAAAIYKNKSALYSEGRGSGLSFLDYTPDNVEQDFGYFVSAPHNSNTTVDVDAQALKKVGEKYGGFNVAIGGATPWSRKVDATYLIGKRKDMPHPYTDSAASATSLNAGIKTYNNAINIDSEGRQVSTLAHEMQAEGFAIGSVSSVPFNHATPACVYAHNVHRSDYQDIARDMLGLRSRSHPEKPLAGIDVLIGAGWGVTSSDSRSDQGNNYVPGNKYIAKSDIERVKVANGGKYVVAQRTKGSCGNEVLVDAAAKAIESGHRLFGLFGAQGGSLPFQTADGQFDETLGVSKVRTTPKSDVLENPTLAEMTNAALKVLETKPKGFYLMVEPGHVDWANHNNNIDESIGAVLAGEAAFDVIVEWVEKKSNWDETCLVVTADHGHYFVLDDPEVLTGKRRLGDKKTFESKLAAYLKQKKQEEEKKKAAAAAKLEASKKVSIFDGETTKGWHNPYDWGEVSVKEKEIRLVANKKFFLMSDKQYGDYIFEGEVKLPEGKSNSGFMLRGQEKKNKVFGYQAEADPTDRKWSGGLYDEGRRQWLNPLADQPKAQEAFKKTDWNKYRIVCEGDHLKIFVNGIKTTDYHDPVDLEGAIGLQHHGENGQVYAFRNLKVVNNGRHVWKPIFDGASMEGWKTQGGGEWKLKDGTLVGTSSAEEKRHGLFYSEKEYGNFTARITFRLTEGNSGFYFRSKINESKLGVKGIQAELENSELIGGLYETGGRKWLAKPLHYFETFSKDRQGGREKQWKKAHAAGEWSTMVVSAHGNRIVTHVGDILACDIVDAKQQKNGRFAVQLHGGQDLKVEVKSIELLVKEK